MKNKSLYFVLVMGLALTSCSTLMSGAKEKGCETGCKPAYDKALELCAKKTGKTKTACESAAKMANDKCQKECAETE